MARASRGLARDRTSRRDRAIADAADRDRRRRSYKSAARALRHTPRPRMIERALIVVPFPHALDQYQAANAAALTKSRSATIVPQNELAPEQLAAAILRDALAAPAKPRRRRWLRNGRRPERGRAARRPGARIMRPRSRRDRWKNQFASNREPSGSGWIRRRHCRSGWSVCFQIAARPFAFGRGCRNDRRR